MRWAWAEQQGIVRGFDDGTFRPEGRITRQQLAAILFRYTEYRGADTAGRTDLSRFSDSAAVADYAREALAWAVSARTAPGPVRRHAESVRLRHPGPDGSDPPAAGKHCWKRTEQSAGRAGTYWSPALHASSP